MPNEGEWIDAVAMSRQLRIETGEKLAKMTREERIRYFRELAETDPVFRKMKKYVPPGHSSASRQEAK